jgi:hypothetical protein
MNSIIQGTRLAIFAFSVLSATTVFAADPSPESLLKDSDAARGSSAVTSGISWEVTVDSDDGSSKNSVVYDLKVKANDAVAEAVSPARNKGEMMLFNDRNIWFFKPGMKKPLAISPRQKLMGQAANGDIASTNYARDYEGKIVGTETVNGQATWKLELKAKAKNVTYDQIRYWISKKEKLGIKAEFLTVSGDVFKRASFEYKNKIETDGKRMPFVSKMTITDAVNEKQVTTLNYKSPRPEKHPDSIFNVNNLLR